MFVFVEIAFFALACYLIYRLGRFLWKRAHVQEKKEELSNVIDLEKLTRGVDKKEAKSAKKKVDDFLKD